MPALQPSTRHRAVERLSHMVSRCRYVVQPTLQYEVAVLLADLHDTATLHHLARKLAEGVLDHTGLAFMQRFRIDRGAVVPVLSDALDTDSERYRFGLMKYAITMSERRRRGADAVAAAHLVHAVPGRNFGGGRTVFEDVAMAAALPWVPRTGAGDLSGILHRTAGTPHYRVEVLSTVGRPEVAGDAPYREAAITEIERCRSDVEPGASGLWWDLHRAVAWRRHGHTDRAHRLLASVVDRMPDLAGEPDGSFVGPVHRDVVHGPCLQGLVLEYSLELATLGDFERSRRLAVNLLEFAAEDGVTAFMHLVHQMHFRAVAESEIADSIELFFALADRNLPRLAADLAVFQAARGLCALIGSQPNLQRIAEERLRSLCTTEQIAQARGFGRRHRAVAVLAAALAYAFDRSGDTEARDRCLRLGKAEAARQLTEADASMDLTLFRYLALSDEGSPVANLLRDHERSSLRHYINDLRDYLADRDDHGGVIRLSALLDDDQPTLSTACLQLRALKRPLEASAVVEKCRALTDFSSNRVILLSYADHMVTDAREKVHDEIDHEIEAAKAELGSRSGRLLGHRQPTDLRSLYPFEYRLALALARAGRTQEALRRHARATSLYDESVEWYRIMGMRLGGDPYYNDRDEDPDYDEFVESVADNILDADRQLIVALAAAGQTGAARDLALAIASDRDSLLDRRIQIALRVAAECGATDILRSLLKQVRDRAQVAAWVADHIGDESLCRRPPVHLGSLTQLAAATMGSLANMTRTLAALIVADPAMAVDIVSAHWLEILTHEKETV
ncbi:hypothetical protein [Streptomyces chartreusis]|uniref:hypothetical protein n=1 Tax=Streptomyces chartreusis TaxID=1969 RepID=UPI00364F85F0